LKQQEENDETVRTPIRVSRSLIYICVFLVACIVLIFGILKNRDSAGNVSGKLSENTKQSSSSSPAVSFGVASRQIPDDAWKSPDENSIPAGKEGETIRYGRELLAHTAQYFGPKGSIAMISNGMNCQNCHLAGGTKLFGNDYASFISSYPKMSNRSGRVEPAAERIAECFERSLAGTVPDTAGREVQAMLAYMKWVGKDVKNGQNLFGNATEKLAYLDYAADPVKGEAVFMMKCKSCHGANGEGVLNADKKTYVYPPLWGKHSYNDGAGMYRISNFAGFVKNNMPLGTTYQNPQLTDEEAWNVAAFVNSQPRPHRDQRDDWKDLSKKPIDSPFGPYADAFSEKQHKYGPFKPIKDAQKQLANNNL